MGEISMSGSMREGGAAVIGLRASHPVLSPLLYSELPRNESVVHPCALLFNNRMVPPQAARTSSIRRARRWPYSTKFARMASSLAVLVAVSWNTTTMWGSMEMARS